MTFSSLAGTLDDWINPIAVKEMRQAVNGRLMAWTLTAFLLIQVGIVASVLLFSETYQYDFSIGRNVFMGLLGVLLGTCLFYLPISTSARFATERFQQNIDLLFITTLKPVQIIWGKTLAAMALLLLFFTASMPFMMLTYLLRGIDLQSSIILLGLDFLAVCACIQVAIWLATIPGPQVLRLLIGLPILFGAFIFVWQISYGMLHNGIGTRIGPWGVWAPALTIASFVILGAGLLFVLSVTNITHPTANRALGIRIYLFFAWLTTGIVIGIWSIIDRSSGPIGTWLVVMALLFSANLFNSIGEPHEPGPRVLRTIPQKRLPRFLAFFLYSGVASGISYSILMIVGTFAVAALFLDVAALLIGPGYKSGGFEDSFIISAVFALYALVYSLTALTIKRFFFAHSKRPQITAEIAAILFLAGAMVPLIIGLLLFSDSLDQLPPVVFWGNPFVPVFLDRDVLHEYTPIACIWAVAVLVITLPWLKRQYLNFKPPVPVQITYAGPSDE